MESFLLNPNFAYLVVVSAFLLTVFAIITPGTGLLEVGALLVLTLAGYQILNMPINLWALVLLVAGLVTFVMAVRRKNESAFLAATALLFVVGSAYFFQPAEGAWYQPAVHPAVASAVSVLAGGFFWVMTTKMMEAAAQNPAHDLTSLIGSVGETRTKVHHEGSVYVLGEMWTARSEKPIKEGVLVKVVGREGFVLDVEEIH